MRVSHRLGNVSARSAQDCPPLHTWPLIRPDRGSCYHVSPCPPLPPRSVPRSVLTASPTPSATSLSRRKKVEATGKKVRYLNIGDPNQFGFLTPPHLIEAVAKAMRDGHNGYTASPGIVEAREAVAADFTRRGVETSADRVLITSGTSEGIELALTAIVDEGEEVLVPSPTYPLYTAVLAKIGATPVSDRTDTRCRRDEAELVELGLHLGRVDVRRSSIGISTDSKPHFLNCGNSLVDSVVNGDVNRNVLIPSLMVRRIVQTARKIQCTATPAARHNPRPITFQDNPLVQLPRPQADTSGNVSETNSPTRRFRPEELLRAVAGDAAAARLPARAAHRVASGWRRSARSPPSSPTSSTTCSRRSSATRSSPSQRRERQARTWS